MDHVNKVLLTVIYLLQQALESRVATPRNFLKWFILFKEKKSAIHIQYYNCRIESFSIERIKKMGVRATIKKKKKMQFIFPR